MAETRAPEDAAVLVYDSGVGGLAVLHECLVSFREQRFVYMSDDGRFPYGAQSKECVRRAVSAMLEEVSFPVAALVLASGSVAATAVDVAQERFPNVPVLDASLAEVQVALKLAPKGRIGFLSSPLAAQSALTKRLLHERAPAAEVVISSSAEIARLVQRGTGRDPLLIDAVERAVRPFREASVDVVVLNCTHAMLVEDVIRRHVGRRIPVVDARVELAEQLRAHVEPSGPPGCTFLTSGDPHTARASIARYLQWPHADVLQAGAPPKPYAEREHLIEALYDAFSRGDFAQLSSMLGKDVVLWKGASATPSVARGEQVIAHLQEARQGWQDCEIVIREFLHSGSLSASSGHMLVFFRDGGQPSALEFAHQFHFEGARVARITDLSMHLEAEPHTDE
jgi:glutamate racemase